MRTLEIQLDDVKFVNYGHQINNMENQQPVLKIQTPNQGWKQFLTARDEMLSAYDKARKHSVKRDVQTGHGNVAEAEFRKWLQNFLPKRYGVTSGYIISQGIPNSETFVHYDVIIYDQLESPILWIDSNPDCSSQGRSLAIPVEYVRGVIEVKSAFNKRSAKNAVAQLAKLKPLMAKTDPIEYPSKLYLPKDFFCATVFFELRTENEMDFTALDEVNEATSLRGFYGGYILRVGKLGEYYSGKITVLKERDNNPFENQSLFFWAKSKCKKFSDKTYVRTQLFHSETHFSEFAFDILALLKGTYNPNVLSSMYGFGSTQWEKGSAVDRTYFCPEDVQKFEEENAKYFKQKKS